MPYLKAAGELKTKPTQHSVKELQRHRHFRRTSWCAAAEHELPEDMRAKIGLFCNLPADCVIQNLNARSHL